MSNDNSVASVERVSRPVVWNGKPWVFAEVRINLPHTPTGTMRWMAMEVALPYDPARGLLDTSKDAIAAARVMIDQAAVALQTPDLDPQQ